jgi:invasion protein IalB
MEEMISNCICRTCIVKVICDDACEAYIKQGRKDYVEFMTINEERVKV